MPTHSCFWLFKRAGVHRQPLPLVTFGLLCRSLVFGLILFGGMAPPAPAATPFVHETVDDIGNVGEHVSLALDADGNPHISYYDATQADLKYAVRLGGVWSVETVDPVDLSGQYTSIALDSQGRPHISYHQADSGSVRYATKSGGVWSIETLEGGLTLDGITTSIALDDQDNPRISYYRAVGADLRFAQKNSGVWSFETVDSGGDVGLYSSLALDDHGNPRIAFWDVTGSDLRIAEWRNGWSKRLVDGLFSAVGEYASLAVDNAANPHMSYYAALGPLMYATRLQDNTWTQETVDGTGDNVFTSIELDSQGHVYISYVRANENVSLATNKSGIWRLETVESGQYLGSSLALDAQDNPMVAYYDADFGALKYADSAVHLLAPNGGETWPVGADRTVTWSGAGRVDVLLSTDGGQTFDVVADDVTGNSVPIQVPHTPSRFAVVQVRRDEPFSTSQSDSLFTIETDIALLQMKAVATPEGGAHVSWSTDPGPDDLAGYRLDRRSLSGTWQTLVELSRTTSFVDALATPGSEYRLWGINGLGQEFVLGEVHFGVARSLAAWPLPYSTGAAERPLSISYAIYGRLGDAQGDVTVALYDARGRVVRTLARGSHTQGSHFVTWDGRDARGRRLPAGTYFLRSLSAHHVETLKVVLTP